VLPPTTHAQQATLDGNIINIPVVVFEDQFYEIQLGLVPNTNPPELELVAGWEVFNKESEVENENSVNGLWSIFEQVTPQTCELDPYAESYDVQIVRDGNQLTVTSPVGEFSGEISGNALNWDINFSEDGGTVNSTINVIFSPEENSLLGTASTNWSDGDVNCSGTSNISGRLEIPEETPYGEFVNEEPSMPYIFNSVDLSATKFDGTILSIPSITVNGINFWADLELVSDSPIQFKLVGSGLSDVLMGLQWSERTEMYNGAVFHAEGAGSLEISFNPVTGLLHDALIGEDHYVFANYTATTVDIFRITEDGVEVFADLPLTGFGQSYVEEMTADVVSAASAEALTMPDIGYYSTSLFAAVTEEETDEESIQKNKAAERSGKGLDFLVDLLVDAVDSGRVTVPQLTLKLAEEIGKSIGHKLIKENIGKDAADKYQIANEAREGMDTIKKCEYGIGVNSLIGRAYACYKYGANKKNIDSAIKKAAELGVTGGNSVIDYYIERTNEAQQHQMEFALGCDAMYLSDPGARQDCYNRLGNRKNGKTLLLLDTDRDNNGIHDFEQSDSYNETSLGEYLAYAERHAAQKALYGEEIGWCPAHFGVKVDFISQGIYDTSERDPHEWWWGCTNNNLQKMGIWTRYWEDPDKRPATETIEVETIAFRYGLRHGQQWKRDPYDPTTYETSNWQDGKLDGAWESYFQGNFNFLHTYKEHEKHGPWIDYMPGGASDSGDVGQYKDGLKDGPWKGYLQDELHWEGQFSNGLPVGDHKVYFNGELDFTDRYDNQGNFLERVYADEQE